MLNQVVSLWYMLQDFFNLHPEYYCQKFINNNPIMKNPETNSVIKVAIADDHAIFRTGVKTSLQARKDIQMVAEAENGMQLLNLLRHIQPDVVLLDIQMPIMDGLTT